MFKALFTADLHMSNTLPFSKILSDGVTDRIEDQMQVWKQIYKIAKKQEVNALFVLGDLFDRSKVDAVTLTKTVEAMMLCPVPVYILPGNHDATTTSGGRFTVEAFAAMSNDNINVIGLDHIKPLVFGKTHFWSISFRTKNETEVSIKQIKKKMDRGKRNVLLLHTSINGAEAYSWICDDGIDVKFLKGFDLVLSGHFHKRQSVAKNAFYVGSPMQHHFGDSEKISDVCIIKFGKKTKMDFVEIDSPRFFVLKGHNRIKLFKPGDYIRFELKCPRHKVSEVERNSKKECERWEKDGFKVSYKIIPTIESKQRLTVDVGNDSLDLDKAIDNYAEFMNSDKEIASLGKDILRSVISD